MDLKKKKKLRYVAVVHAHANATPAGYEGILAETPAVSKRDIDCFLLLHLLTKAVLWVKFFFFLLCNSYVD